MKNAKLLLGVFRFGDHEASPICLASLECNANRKTRKILDFVNGVCALGVVVTGYATKGLRAVGIKL